MFNPEARSLNLATAVAIVLFHTIWQSNRRRGIGQNEGAKTIYAHHNGRNCIVPAYTVWLNVKQLSVQQSELVSSLAKQLGEIKDKGRGARRIACARTCQPDSDIDLGLLYSEAAPFSIQSVRELAESVNDTSRPVVTSFYEWGRWVNGGAWLTIGGQRVDFIYRSLEQVEQVIAEAEAGRYELDYNQQPPFGFFSGTYLGEIAVCVP